MKPPTNEFGKAGHSLAIRSQIIASQFARPLPPPDTLERYDQIFPGVADRIITMA